MKQYLDLVKTILEKGELKEDRTGTGTISLFGAQVKYDLREGFPLLTTKKVLFDAVVRELLWFLRGSTNINDDLTQHTPIWNAWANEKGELGPIYGYQWRKWEKFEGTTARATAGRGAAGQAGNGAQGTVNGIGFYKKEHIDQIQNAIDMIKKNPDSRRIIVSAWNASDIDKMKLPPCHLLFQFYVANRRLDCQLYQRSADIALGVPFNIASYATLMHMMAAECGLTAGVFTHTLGDAHIYLNHVDGLREQMTRTPYPLPQLKIAQRPFWDLKFEDFTLENYQHHPFIKFHVAV